jgi:hypothetical protein
MGFFVINNKEKRPGIGGVPTYYTFLSTTPTLNHNGHNGGDFQTGNFHKTPALYNIFNAHRWIHVAMMWGYDEAIGISSDFPGFIGNKDTKELDSNIYCKIWINGEVLDAPYFTYFCWAWDSMFGPTGGALNVVDSTGKVNPLLIGGGFSTKADSTIDELYVFGDYMKNPNATYTHVTEDIWGKGRYYHDADYPSEFTSGSIDFGKVSWGSKGLAGPGGDKYPDGGNRPSGVDLSYVGDYSPLILGVTWTAYNDDVHDHRNQVPGGQPIPINSECNLLISVDNGAHWINENTLPMKKYWWQWIWRNTEGQNPLRYKVKFDLTIPENAILLESPIFDDVSIYYKGGKVEFLTWVLV